MTRLGFITGFLLAGLAALVLAWPAGSHLPRYCGHEYKYISELTANIFDGHYGNRDHRVETWTYSPTARAWRFNDAHRWDCH